MAKIGIVVEEADEAVFWLEMLSDCQIVPADRLKELLRETRELSTSFTASQQSAKVRGR